VKLQSIVGTSLVALVLAGQAFAQSTPFDVTGELRVRNENDARDFDPATDSKSFNVMRTRLGITVRPVTDMSVFVQVQDSRIHGQSNVVVTDPSVQEDGKLDLHQGFFQVQNLGWQGFGVKAGRMEVAFGNQRLVGVDDWNNVNQSFDGVMATLDVNRFSGQLLWANLNEADNSVIGDPALQDKADADMQAVFGTVGVNDVSNVDLYVINASDKVTVADDDDVRVTTFGSRVHGKAVEMVDYTVEGAYQIGEVEVGPSLANDVSAHMLGAEVGVTVGDVDRPVRFGVGVDRLSGDGDGADDKIKVFNTLFGDNHKFYGLADVADVLAVNSATDVVSNTGLQDLKVNAAATVWRNENNVVKLGGEFHNFRLVEAPVGVSNALGNEVDVHASWAYKERFVPTVGFSAFLPGDAIPDPAPAVDPSNSYWFYAQGTVSF
jgi:hypothetical protein